MADVKTTIDIPDALFRKAKSRAAERGQTLKDFVTEALQARLSKESESGTDEPRWMQGFGKLHRLRKESARIRGSIQDEFEQIEAEDRL